MKNPAEGGARARATSATGIFGDAALEFGRGKSALTGVTFRGRVVGHFELKKERRRQNWSEHAARGLCQRRATRLDLVSGAILGLRKILASRGSGTGRRTRGVPRKPARAGTRGKWRGARLRTYRVDHGSRFGLLDFHFPRLKDGQCRGVPLLASSKRECSAD